MNKWMLEWVTTIAIGVVLAVLVKMFVADVAYIRGESMEPTFQDEDIVLAEKWSGRLDKLAIGDVVILKTDKIQGAEKRLIKRIVGLPGDVIEIKDGVLYRNGKTVKETYIKEKMETDFAATEVLEGHAFVLGDNRNNSTDSRIIGAVELKDINGRVFVELWGDILQTY